MKQSAPPAWPSVTCSKHPHSTQVISCSVWANVHGKKDKEAKGKSEIAGESQREEDRDLRKAWCWNVPPLAKWQACNQYRSITEADPWRTVCSSERNLTVMRADISSDVTPTWNYEFLIAELELTDRLHAARTCHFTMEHVALHFSLRAGRSRRSDLNVKLGGVVKWSWHHRNRPWSSTGVHRVLILLL